MKSTVVGMGRPAWSPIAPCTPNYGGTAGCASHIQQQKTSNSDTGTSACIGRVVSSNQAGTVSFVGLRGLSRGKEEPCKLRRRLGELGGDCCLASGGSVGTSRNFDRGIVRAKGGAGSKGSNDDSRSDGGEEQGPSSVWDLSARHKRIQEAAAKVGDPFRDMMTNASKKLQDYLDNIKMSRTKEVPPVEKAESEWDQWKKLFAEVDERERLVSVLKFQMEEAVDSENFEEAAALKQTIASATASDTVSEVMNGLKEALKEERYSDAARFCDKAGAGMVGWWVGLADGGKDPYGRIIHITASQGKFIAKSYSARQLVAAATGVPLFELFVRKDQDDEFVKQAVYLQRDGNVAADVVMGPTSKDVDMTGATPQTGSKGNQKTKDSSSSSDKNENTPKNAEDFIDEGINNIISFLKDRMPDVKLKVLQVIAPDGLDTDIPKLVEQMMEAEEKEDEGKDAGDEASTLENPVIGQSEQDKISDDSSTSSPDDREIPIRLVIGGVLQNAADDKFPRTPLRVPAKIEHKSKDEFVFHIEDNGDPSSSSVSTTTKESLPSWKVATIATQASADLMPDDVAKVLWNVDKGPVKVSKEMGEIIRLAVSQAQRRRGLSKSTSFRRIMVSDGGMDPLNGLYIGTFGPYTSEVVQLKRKYGQWQDDNGFNLDKLEFFEYVEAVKLTGDLNVPAGQVTFRAKIGRENRLSLRGAYPEELGVVGRYKGQGRLADPGFRNPQWIDGEMVLLDGKGGGHTNGAELGFVYSVPERHFLVLFNRLNLKD